jgi:cell division septum initiation protein DivIVA
MILTLDDAQEYIEKLEAENAELKTELQSWKDSRDGIMAENEALAYSKMQTEAENSALRQQVEDLKEQLTLNNIDYLKTKEEVDAETK